MTKQLALIAFFSLTLLPSTLVFSSPNENYDFPVLKGVFFTLMDTVGPLDLTIKNEDKAVEQLLKEAQYIFSAMIYGLEFTYIPQDNARGVAEEYTIKPVFLIPWGDPSLTADEGSYNIEEGRYEAILRYQVKEEQMPWLLTWQTNIHITTGGTGQGSLYKGFEGKIEAINNSIKESIRNYLRPRNYNKPRKISGTAWIVEVPHITMNSGKYSCKTKTTLSFTEIQEYKHY